MACGFSYELTAEKIRVEIEIGKSVLFCLQTPIEPASRLIARTNCCVVDNGEEKWDSGWSKGMWEAATKQTVLIYQPLFQFCKKKTGRSKNEWQVGDVFSREVWTVRRLNKGKVADADGSTSMFTYWLCLASEMCFPHHRVPLGR